MQCPKCGYNIRENVKTCPNCGRPTFDLMDYEFEDEEEYSEPHGFSPSESEMEKAPERAPSRPASAKKAPAKKKKNSDGKTVVIIILVFIIGLAIGFIAGKSVKFPNETTETTTAETTTVEESTTEAETTTVPETTTEAETTETTTDSGIVCPYNVGKYKVTNSTGVNMRSEPNSSSTIAAQLSYGDVFNVTEISYNEEAQDEAVRYWGKTTFNGTTGWVALAYAEYQKDAVATTAAAQENTTKAATTVIGDYAPGAYTVTSTYPLKLRSEHNSNSTNLAQIPTGTAINVTEVYCDSSAEEYLQYWGKISYEGNTGWVALYYTQKA